MFHLTAGQFDGASAIDIVNVTLGEQIIVNIDGPGHTMTDTTFSNAGTSGNTFFNFIDPAGLTFTRLDIPGTVLAPNAAITLTGLTGTHSVIEGSLYVKSIAAATDYTIGNANCPLPSIPEPATVGLLAAGAAALLLRRRRA